MKALVWLSVPAVIIALFASVLAVVSWISFTRSSIRFATAARQVAGGKVLAWTTERQRAMIGLYAASACLIVVAYLLAQLVGVTVEKWTNDRSITDVLTFDSRYMGARLVQYPAWTPLATWSVSIAFLSALALSLANLFDAGRLAATIKIAWNIMLVIGVWLGILAALVGMCVLVAGLTRQDDFVPSMAVWYLPFVAGLWAPRLLWDSIENSSERAFGG